MKQRLPAFIFFLFLTGSLLAGNRYWVGGSGSWNDVSHWAATEAGQGGASIPGLQDHVFLMFDGQNSIDTIRINSIANCGGITYQPAGSLEGKEISSGTHVVLEGNGTINVNGSLDFHSQLTDHFTGTWKFNDENAIARDNSLPEIHTSGQVFSGKVIFTTPSIAQQVNSYLISDVLYVNNTLEIQQAAQLIVAKNTTVAVKELAADANGLLNQGGKILSGNASSARFGNPPSPQSHSVTTIIVPSLCNGDCAATATAVVTGGSGNFIYVWSNGDNTATADSLCAGTYLVVVTDVVNGDQVPAFAVVNDPPPLVIFFFNTSPQCNGNCDGSSSASVAGGTPPYTYSWAPGGQTTPAITNQCAGIYTLTVTDANNCTVTQQTVITQPAVLNPHGVSTNVTCFAACNGTATVAPTGGTPPYTYSWAPGGQITPGITGLCPGTYTCTITDSHTCTATYVATITQPALLQVSITHTNASCFGVCDGTASSTVTGGTAPYSFLWTPGGQTTPNVTNRCAGTYTLNVTDANGCTASATVTITEPPQLLVNPTGVNIACFNQCNGTAAANASGGTSPYSYSWSPTGGNGPVASSLCPNTYTVNVTDANGCAASGTVTITQPTQLMANASGTDVSCFNQCNGTATANPSGGVGPYSYQWQPGNLNTQTITNLCAGSYTVTVTDANNCTATQTVTITQPTQLQTGASSTNVTCNAACNGTATSSPSGGVGPYTYSWAPGGQTTPSISGLCPGSYTLTVTDANGCTRNATITITQPNPLNVTINATQISCNSSCNGTAAASVSGGTPTYTYSWSPGGQTTPAISSLCAGTYTVSVNDANNCSTTASVTITQPTALTLITGFNNASCSGSCNGSASVTPSGGTAPYSYSWAPGGQTTSSINGLCAGSYTVTVNDALGCSNTATITITQPNALVAGVTSINVTCNNACNGSANANPSGGTAPYTFLWAPGGQTTSSVTGLCVGTYTCTVTDANGCTVNQQVSITQPPPLLAVVTSTTSSCGLCTGTATVAASGGTAPYAYFWTPSNQTNPTATGLCVGNYTVTVTDAAGCTTTATCTVNQVVNIVITSSTNTLSCFGSCDGVASANAAGGTNPYTYSWQPGNFTTQTITGLCAGAYTVTATDANACFNTATVTFTNPPLLTVTATNTNVSCNSACDGTATANPSGGTGAYSYSWAPGGQTTQSVNGLCAGTYTVTVTDANNCTATQTVTITEAALIAANAAVTDANCTLCDGSITANPTGGIGPYTYSWAPGGQTTQTITNLCPGIYTVTITDATNCSIVQPVAVGNINGPTSTSASTNTSCNASCDGTATVNVTGGVSPFTYDWSPGAPIGDGTPAVTGLCAGTYFCDITDAVGCQTFETIVITQPQPLTVTASITNISCNGSTDGSITANPSGGTGPYTYAWLPGGQITQTISGLAAGTYTVTVTDANNCTTTQQFSITQPLPLSASMAFTNVLCNSACNGTATVSVAGGTTPYSYSWSSGQGTANVVNMCPGTYTVDVTDGRGCTTQQTVTITEPTQLVTSITSTNASCNGVCDGTATVTANGGTPGYSYTWSPGGGTTPTASGLCAGAYSVITSDANGCSSVNSVTIQEPPAIVLSASSGPLSCNGNCNGVAMVTANGGSPGYTYSWSPGGQTTQTATALCAGTYTVTVTDNNGCSQNVSTTVTQPALLQANTSFTSPQCSGGCNGTASANPVGGTGPYQYLWAPGGQTTSTITNICPGTYTVTVNDANGCQDIQSVNVLAISPMTLAVASAPATCGSCDGTISVTPSGGSAPYTYSWTGGLPPQANQSGVCAGIYTVTVTDATNCVGTFTITLNNNGGPTGETVVTSNVTCPGGSNGSATITPIGGASPYSYLWVPSGQIVNTITNVPAGTYFLQVTDSNGCIRFSPATITEPPPIVASPFVSNASCSGICDGSIALSPTGGTGPYTYSWSPGGQTTSSITNVCVGTYTATITDAAGCTQTSISTVNPWNTLSANVTLANPSCNNTCNGSATANITSGTGPFTYLWTDPLGQSGQTATGLCAGSYSVAITNQAGCSTTASVTLVAPSAIVINPNITPTTCGQCNGSVTLNASGGSGPYTYMWSNGAPTATVNNLCAGVYSVIVFDATGCSATFTVSVSSSGGPTASNATVTNVSCSGTCDGSISLAPTGGTAPYTYFWVPSGQTTSSVSSLCTGTYNVQIRDAAGCILTDSFTITAPPSIVPGQTITNTDCGLCTGTISLNPSGGTGPYTYSWAPGGQTTSAVNGLCAGMYTVTITDATGCAHTQAIPVSNQNSSMTVTATGTNVTCNASCNGTATVSVTGGTGPYTYTWSNSMSGSNISGLCAGNYIVQATDANGCVNTGQVSITQPSPLAVSLPFTTNVLCANACDGSIMAIPSGGTLPYTYSWTPTGQTTQTAVNLCAGAYMVTVQDANGCTITQNDTIVAPVVLVLSNPVVTNASCSNSPDGAVTISVNGGATPYTYSWTGPNSFTAATQNLTNVLPGSYTLTIQDANGCSIMDTIVVGANTTIVANAGNDTTFCQSGSVSLSGAQSVNATGYQWVQLPGMTTVGNSVSVSLNPPVGTTTYLLIVTNGTCSDTDTVIVTSLAPPVANAGPDQEIITGMTTTIGGSPTGPAGSTFAWGPSTGLGDPTMANPVASPSASTTYTVVVTDANGCTDSDTMDIIVVPAINFPNGFTPNGDGINDVWQIDNIQLFENCTVEVYNRWGELLFSSTGYNIPWDGRYNGKDLPVGTYYYIIKLNDPYFPDVYTGPVTIMR